MSAYDPERTFGSVPAVIVAFQLSFENWYIFWGYATLRKASGLALYKTPPGLAAGVKMSNAWSWWPSRYHAPRDCLGPRPRRSKVLARYSVPEKVCSLSGRPITSNGGDRPISKA